MHNDMLTAIDTQITNSNGFENEANFFYEIKKSEHSNEDNTSLNNKKVEESPSNGNISKTINSCKKKSILTNVDQKLEKYNNNSLNEEKLMENNSSNNRTESEKNIQFVQHTSKNSRSFMQFKGNIDVDLSKSGRPMSRSSAKNLMDNQIYENSHMNIRVGSNSDSSKNVYNIIYNSVFNSAYNSSYISSFNNTYNKESHENNHNIGNKVEHEKTENLYNNNEDVENNLHKELINDSNSDSIDYLYMCKNEHGKKNSINKYFHDYSSNSYTDTCSYNGEENRNTNESLPINIDCESEKTLDSNSICDINCNINSNNICNYNQINKNVNGINSYETVVSLDKKSLFSLNQNRKNNIVNNYESENSHKNVNNIYYKNNDILNEFSNTNQYLNYFNDKNDIINGGDNGGSENNDKDSNENTSNCNENKISHNHNSSIKKHYIVESSSNVNGGKRKDLIINNSCLVNDENRDNNENRDNIENRDNNETSLKNNVNEIYKNANNNIFSNTTSYEELLIKNKIKMESNIEMENNIEIKNPEERELIIENSNSNCKNGNYVYHLNDNMQSNPQSNTQNDQENNMPNDAYISKKHTENSAGETDADAKGTDSDNGERNVINFNYKNENLGSSNRENNYGNSLNVDNNEHNDMLKNSNYIKNFMNNEFMLNLYQLNSGSVVSNGCVGSKESIGNNRYVGSNLCVGSNESSGSNVHTSDDTSDISEIKIKKYKKKTKIKVKPEKKKKIPGRIYKVIVRGKVCWRAEWHLENRDNANNRNQNNNTSLYSERMNMNSDNNKNFNDNVLQNKKDNKNNIKKRSKQFSVSVYGYENARLFALFELIKYDCVPISLKDEANICVHNIKKNLLNSEKSTNKMLDGKFLQFLLPDENNEYSSLLYKKLEDNIIQKINKYNNCNHNEYNPIVEEKKEAFHKLPFFNDNNFYNGMNYSNKCTNVYSTSNHIVPNLNNLLYNIQPYDYGSKNVFHKFMSDNNPLMNNCHNPSAFYSPFGDEKKVEKGMIMGRNSGTSGDSNGDNNNNINNNNINNNKDYSSNKNNLFKNLLHNNEEKINYNQCNSNLIYDFNNNNYYINNNINNSNQIRCVNNGLNYNSFDLINFLYSNIQKEHMKNFPNMCNKTANDNHVVSHSNNYYTYSNNNMNKTNNINNYFINSKQLKSTTNVNNYSDSNSLII